MFRTLIVVGLLVAIAPARAAVSPADLMRAALDLACPGPAPAIAEMAASLGRTAGQSAIAVADEPVTMRGQGRGQGRNQTLGWRRRIALGDGGQIEIERFAPGGLLRRINVIQHEAAGDKSRPVRLLMATADCRIVQGRRLVYGPDGSAAEIEILGPDLARIVGREPLNPPLLPAARGTGRAGVTVGVAVAMVDSGVNYRLPGIAARLARDARGQILGFDFWDMDDRPFDANPAPSPFFVRRHGTRTASVLLREAPGARLVPYRYPRPDMDRMADIVARAAADGIVIVAMPLGSNRAADWRAFADAAAARPEMLFVVSAGNNGRDIDSRPVYPAALALGNMITVTSARDDGRLARGSNWGRKSVDLMVPAENQPVIDFSGRAARSSGSSFAVPRVAALAARLLARHPDWRAPELKRAILARAVATPESAKFVGAGLIADPAAD